MTKKQTIENWEIGELFGARVLRGSVGGERRTVMWRYWSHGVFGVSTGRHYLEEVWKVGMPSSAAFDGLRP